MTDNKNLTSLIPSRLPAYAEVLYGDVYNDFDRYRVLDSQKSADRRSLFRYDELVEALLKEVKMSQIVLQFGCVFGSQMSRLADHIGAYGTYDIIDINHFQVDCAKEKYGSHYACMDMNFICADAASYCPKHQYDVVVCFLLLQELPPLTQAKVINSALSAVAENGKAIFIDFHNPAWFHPLRWPVKMYNRLKLPFAEKLWEHDIDTYAENRTDFQWRKTTYFGRMYQKVVAVRKSNSLANQNPSASEIAYNPADY